MRFLVDAYRYLILLILGLALIGASYGVSTLFLGDGGTNPLSGAVLIGVIVAVVFVVLSIGLTATFISIHDRLADIASHMRSIAERMDASAYSKYDSAER